MGTREEQNFVWLKIQILFGSRDQVHSLNNKDGWHTQCNAIKQNCITPFLPKFSTVNQASLLVSLSNMDNVYCSVQQELTLSLHSVLATNNSKQQKTGALKGAIISLLKHARQFRQNPLFHLQDYTETAGFLLNPKFPLSYRTPREVFNVHFANKIGSRKWRETLFISTLTMRGEKCLFFVLVERTIRNKKNKL